MGSILKLDWGFPDVEVLVAAAPSTQSVSHRQSRHALATWLAPMRTHTTAELLGSDRPHRALFDRTPTDQPAGPAWPAERPRGRPSAAMRRRLGAAAGPSSIGLYSGAAARARGSRPSARRCVHAGRLLAGVLLDPYTTAIRRPVYVAGHGHRTH